MTDYKSLKKSAKEARDRAGLKDISFALLGDTATQFLKTAIEGYGAMLSYRADVYESEYDVIDSEVLDENSGLYESARDIVIIYMSPQKAYESFTALEMPKRRGFAEEYAGRIRGYWDTIKERTSSAIIQFGMNGINGHVMGDFANRQEDSFEFQLEKLKYLMMCEAAKREGVYLLDLDRIERILGRDVFTDMRFYYDARMAISTEALPYVAKGVYDIALAIKGQIKKCVIFDLDNTIWGGVIGDDLLSGIELGELGDGRIYSDIQRYLLELKKRGIILAVCSKNDEETAKEPFLEHPDMILGLDDIAVFVANWEDKASNIRYIQETLNIGMDSMVFLDDNPFERELVREMTEDITVPELPEQKAEWLNYLSDLNLFEVASYSEGSDRTRQYREESLRRSEQKKYSSIDDYLKSLDMEAECASFDEFRFPRIAELSQRSNQFNLRTVRYTEDEIRRIAESDGYLTRYYSLKDRFGDHGLISAVIIKKTKDDEGFIDTWFMSCRVLKRGMEEFIINDIVALCKEAGIRKLVGEYLATKKNGMVEHIYADMGFDDLGEGRYAVDCGTFTKRKTYIRSSLRP